MATSKFTPVTAVERISVTIGVTIFMLGVFVFLVFGTVKAVFNISLLGMILSLF